MARTGLYSRKAKRAAMRPPFAFFTCRWVQGAPTMPKVGQPVLSDGCLSASFSQDDRLPKTTDDAVVSSSVLDLRKP